MVDLMVDPDSQDAYWAAAVLRTEDMLDGIYKRLKASHGTRRFEPAIRFSLPQFPSLTTFRTSVTFQACEGGAASRRPYSEAKSQTPGMR